MIRHLATTDVGDLERDFRDDRVAHRRIEFLGLRARSEDADHARERERVLNTVALMESKMIADREG